MVCFSDLMTTRAFLMGYTPQKRLWLCTVCLQEKKKNILITWKCEVGVANLPLDVCDLIRMIILSMEVKKGKSIALEPDYSN